MRTQNRGVDGRFRKGVSGNPAGRAPGVPNRTNHLPVDESLAARALARHGHTPEAIAKALHATPEAVKEALASARRVLEMYAPQFVEHWLTASEVAAGDGDHRPALAALQSTKVVEPVVPQYNDKSTAVAAVKVEFVNFGFAGLPPHPPAITIPAPPESRDE